MDTTPSIGSPFSRAASTKQRRGIFKTAFDELIAKINFASEAQAILPENVEITKQAFIEFLHKIDAPLALWSLEELLDEKSGKHAYRADGKTPNWYHEFRNCLNNMSKLREGVIRFSDMEAMGGLDVFLAFILQHDSWEDFGKSPTHIIANFNKKISNSAMNDDRKAELYLGAKMAAHKVDLATRKTPKLDAEGNFVLKETGKIVKIDRFGGDLNIYFDRLLEDPMACLAKFEDANDGMSTRIGVEDFSVEDDRKYTAERRALFGARPFDDESIAAYPYLKAAIRNADAMLGVLLREMETQIYYVPEEGKTYQNPINARPLALTEYLPFAVNGYRLLPNGWHPQCIFLERMENKAIKEMDGHTRDLLDYSFYPGLGNTFPKPYNYVAPLPDYPGYDHTKL